MQNLFFVTHNFLNRKISRFSAALFLAATLAALAGCGSGEALPSPPPPAPPGSAPTAATIQLLTSDTQIESSGTKTVDLTAVVLSSSKQAVSGRTVTFSAPPAPETAFINNISGSGISDSNGLVTAKLNLGNNKLPRSIAVSATADSATDSSSIRVTGTTLTPSGNTSLALNNTTTLNYILKDSASVGIAGIKITLTSSAGNAMCLRASANTSCTPTAATVSGTTDSSGQLVADIKATQTISPDTITATVTGLTDMIPVPPVPI